MKFIFIIQSLLVIVLADLASSNKYSQEANKNVNDMKNPFRMGKLNILWEKARKFLSEPKLKKFLSELKVQDQEELTFKKLKAAGGDKNGLKEAELRKKLLDITERYGIRDPQGHSQQPDDDSRAEKSLFKDKKLHKLWLKAEQSGLTQEELKALKEEFHHHQDKIDEYHTLIGQMSDSTNEVTGIMNDIHQLEDLEGTVDEYNSNINSLRQQHKDLKKGFNDLHRKATSGPDSKEFTEPKVAGLWRLALRADFNDAELESLYTELKHYEGRLFKLRHLENDINKVTADKLEEHFDLEDQEKILMDKSTEAQRILEERVEKQRRKVDKLHDDLEMRIVSRHTEF